MGAGQRAPGDTSLEKRIEYDLYYIQNWSLALDVKIMILTCYRAWQHGTRVAEDARCAG